MTSDRTMKGDASKTAPTYAAAETEARTAQRTPTAIAAKSLIMGWSFSIEGCD